MTLPSTFYLFILSLFLFVDLNRANNSLQQLHILFRHGERSPTETYKNDPNINYTWSGGWGHLTNRGKLQMFKLGQNFRTRYKNFLPDYYLPENVSYFSSYADRCLMSAQLLSAGLFPPVGEQIWNNDLLWQPVPVKYVPRSQDNFIAMKQNCKKYDRLYKELINSNMVVKIKNDNADLFKYLSEHTGSKIETLGQIETLFNTLEIEQLNNLTLPSWVKEEMLPIMKELGAKNLALYSETDYMKRVKGGVLLQRILSSMKRYINGEKEPILNLYSGHDFTLVQILRSLNLVDTIKPKFGATLVFELHKNTDYKIQIYYLDNFEAVPIVKVLNFCEESCDISKFENNLKPGLPTDWKNECEEL